MVNSERPSHQQIISLSELYQSGRLDDAEKLAVSLTQEYHQHPFGWKALGAIFKAKGRRSEAVDANQTAIALSPQDFEAHYNLGNIHKELGKLDEAEASYNRAIALKPDFAEAHSNLGATLKGLRRLDEAEASYNRAIALKPDFAEAHTNLGVTLKGLRRLDEAEASCRQAIALKPNYVEAFYNLGIMLRELGKLDKAEETFNQAIALKPNFAKAYYSLSVTLQELGRLNEAEASYKKVIALKPDYAEAYSKLASVKKFDAQDEHYLKMLELYLNNNISDEQRCHVNFGLAKACDDLGDFKQAFAHYKEGNALRKKLLNYNIRQDTELFRQIKFNYPQIEQNSLASEKFPKDVAPIFIVGMPRSGTTLVEQIISSHSLVTGAGELPYAAQFGSAITKGLTKVDREALLNFRHKYLTKLKSHSHGKLLVTDKMPQNFRLIGLLAAAFPEAKIIHVKRNPAAVCWGNYKQNFASKNLGYCYALDDIVRYHNLYVNLMAFWTNTLNKRIYDLDYEALTINQEEETRQLIDHLDLDWDENCLSPQNNTRSVATASNLQVREKLYQGSSQQWKKYQPFLNGAFDVLLSPKGGSQPLRK